MEIHRAPKRFKHGKDASTETSTEIIEETIINKTTSTDSKDESPQTKRTRLSYQDKKSILEQLNFYSEEIICQKYKISDRTLRKWKKEREKIMVRCNSKTKNSKTLRNIDELETIHQELIKEETIHQELIKEETIHQELMEEETIHQELIEEEKIINKTTSIDPKDEWLRRKRTRLSYQDKKSILEQLNLYSEEIICQKYKISDRTLRKWKREREEIMDRCNSKKKNSKTLRSVDELEKIHQDFMKEETIHQEFMKEETIHQELIKEETIHQELMEEETIHQELMKEETFHQEFIKEETIIDKTTSIDTKDESFQTKRTRLSYEDKKSILEQLNLYSEEIICQKYKISDRTLRKWKQEREKIMDRCNSKTKNSKTLRSVDKLDNRMLMFLLNLCKKQTRITGFILRQEALKINKELGGPENFRASEGWYNKWKQRMRAKFGNT